MICRWLTILFTILFVSGSSADVTADAETPPPQHVTVLGLGAMGRAVVQCLASEKGWHVHAWNRGAANREVLREQKLERVTIHNVLKDAVQASDAVLMLIDMGKDRQNPDRLILESKPSDNDMWNNKTIVQFSNHIPTDASRLNSVAESVGASLVAGALFAVPQTICSDRALILASSNGSVPSSVLEPLGSTAVFESDVGLASLVNLGLFQAIMYGVAGHELAHLILQRYGAPSDVVETYAKLVTQIVPQYVPFLYETISKAISTRDYTQKYVPVDDFRDVVKMHYEFAQEMGISSDIFLKGAMHYLDQVTNPEYGPSEWIEHAVVVKEEEEKEL